MKAIKAKQLPTQCKHKVLSDSLKGLGPRAWGRSTGFGGFSQPHKINQNEACIITCVCALRIPEIPFLSRADAVNKGCSLQHLMRPSIFDRPLMLQVNWPVVDTIHT